MQQPTASASTVQLVVTETRSVCPANKPHFKEGKREEVEAECNKKLVGRYDPDSKTNKPYDGAIPMSELPKYGVGTYLHFYVMNYFALVFSALGLVAGVAAYICYKDQGFQNSEIRMYIEQFTLGNIPSAGDTGKSNLLIFQIYDLTFIVLAMTAIVFLRFWLPRKIRNLERPYPRLEEYSLGIPSKYIPPGMSSSEFSNLFLNKENIIKTALGRNFSDLIKGLKTYAEAEKEARQMEIDLDSAPHVAKQQPTLIYKPSQADLDVLRQQLDIETRKVADMKASKPKVEDYPATVGIITFATIKSKERFLRTYLDGLKSNQLPDLYKINGQVISFEDPGSPIDEDQQYMSDPSTFKGLLMHIAIFSIGLLLSTPFLAGSYGYKVDTLPTCVSANTSVFCACAAEGLISSFSKSACSDYRTQTMVYLGTLSGAAAGVLGGFWTAACAVAGRMSVGRDRVKYEDSKRKALVWTAVACIVCFTFCIRAMVDGYGLDGVMQAASDWAYGNGTSDPQAIANRLGWSRQAYYQIGTPILLALTAQAFIPIMIGSFLRNRKLRKGISTGEEKPHTLEYWRTLFLGSPYPFGEIQAKMDFFIFFGIALTGVPLLTVITSLFFGVLTLFAPKHFSESKQLQVSPSKGLSMGSVWWGYTAVLVRLIVSLLSLTDTWLASISTNLIGSNISLVVDKWNGMIVHQGLLALWILLGLAQLVWYLVQSLTKSSHAFEEEQLKWCEKHSEKDELTDNLPAHTDKLRLLGVDTYSIFRNPEWAVYLKPHFQDGYPDEEPDKQIINLPGQKGADRERTEVNGEGVNKLPGKTKQNAVLPYKLIKAKDPDGSEQPLRNQESKEPNGFTGFVKKIEVADREKGKGPFVGGEKGVQNSNLPGANRNGNQDNSGPYQSGLNEGQASNNTLPNQAKSKNQQNLRQVPGQQNPQQQIHTGQNPQNQQSRLQQAHQPGQNPQNGQYGQQYQQPNGRHGAQGPRAFNPTGQPQEYGGPDRGGRPRLQSNNRVQVNGPYQRNAEGMQSRQDVGGPSGKSTSRNPLVNRQIKNSAFEDDSSFPQLPIYQGEQGPPGLEGNTSQRYGRSGKPAPNQPSLSPSKPFFASAIRDQSGPVPPGYRSVKELGLFKPFENRLYGVTMRVDQQLEPEDNPAFLPGPEEDADFDAALNYRLAMQSAR